MRFLLVFSTLLSILPAALVADTPDVRRARVLSEANFLLEEYQVSYAYGGDRVGTVQECKQCNSCLDSKQPIPSQRFKQCPECYHCSLDCSHFTQLVFKGAGLNTPYLTTQTMLDLTSLQLLKRYKLIDLGRMSERALPGDLLVYRGHVVLLTAQHGKGRGDIIHATGGKDIKEPGQGIQRERFIPLDQFRGPLLRILRHLALVGDNPHARLRPLRKK